MRLDEAIPGEWIFVNKLLSIDLDDKVLAEKTCESLINSIVGECFTLVTKKIDRVVIKDPNGQKIKDDWVVNLGFMTHEPVLKRHAQVLSQQERRKVHPTRFLFDDWANTTLDAQKAKLGQFVKEPAILKVFPYLYDHVNKFAVFFYDASIPIIAEK